MRADFTFRTPTALILTAPTPLGHIAVAVARQRLAAVSMAHDAGPPAANRLARLLGEPLEAASLHRRPEADEQLALEILARLDQLLTGEPVALDDVPVSLDHLSAFQRRVVAACRAIPYGGTRSYGEVAAAAGSPGAARAVGQVMAANRTPLVVPCHRVLAAGGKIGGFSAPQGLALKRRLLVFESAAAQPAESPPRATRRVQRVFA